MQFRLGMMRVLAALALLAMAMRALVPHGYMLQDSATGMTVAMCDGMATLASEQDNDAPSKESGERPDLAHAPCVFAAIAALAPPAPPTLSAPQQNAPIRLDALIASVQPGRGLAAPPPWATGPPRIA